MKKFLLFTCAILSAAAVSAADNLIKNGDFAQVTADGKAES